MPGAHTDSTDPLQVYQACPLCGLVMESRRVPVGRVARCARCSHRLPDVTRGHRRLDLVLGMALAGLVFYPLAISLPVVSLEHLGQRSEASIWAGSLELIHEGEWLVGLVVFLCSVLLPLGKLLTLSLMCWRPFRMAPDRRALLLRAIEVTGRWGMLDVLLIACLVAWVKLGDLVEIHAGPGALAFTLCVLCSLVAGASFESQALFEGGASPAQARPRSTAP